MDLAIEIITEKPKRTEIWNFKNKKNQETFKKLTSETNEFSFCFQNELPVLEQFENWRNTLNKYLRKASKKV